MAVSDAEIEAALDAWTGRDDYDATWLHSPRERAAMRRALAAADAVRGGDGAPPAGTVAAVRINKAAELVNDKDALLSYVMEGLSTEFTLKVSSDRVGWVVITSPEHPGLYIATPRADALAAFADIPIVLAHLLRLDAATIHARAAKEPT